MKFKRWLALCLVCGPAWADEAVMDVIPLQNRPAAELLPLITPMLESGDKLVADGNNLVLKTSSGRLPNLLQLINSLDTPVHNVVISVIQNSHKTAEQLNAEIVKAITPDKIEMQGMNADTRDLQSNRVSRLQTQDGRAAVVKFADVRQQANVQLYANGFNSGLATGSQTLEAGSGFSVTPRLTGRQVILEISPWQENFQQGNQKQVHASSVTIRANLGEWVEISGNVQNNPATGGMNGLNAATQKNTIQHTLLKVDVEGGELLYPTLENAAPGQ